MSHSVFVCLGHIIDLDTERFLIFIFVVVDEYHDLCGAYVQSWHKPTIKHQSHLLYTSSVCICIFRGNVSRIEKMYCYSRTQFLFVPALLVSVISPLLRWCSGALSSAIQHATIPAQQPTDCIAKSHLKD